MKKIVTLFALLFINNAFAQFQSNRFYFGLSAGIARGVNASDDKAVPSFRLFLQHRLLKNFIFGQFGGGYTKLQAKQTYWAKTAYIDERFLIVPYSTEYFLPFLGAGIGLTKAVYSTGTSYLGYSPIFAGIQTRLGENIVFTSYGGFALSFSDSLDGRARDDLNLNPVTNNKQDGFWFWEAGLQFGFPGRKEKTEVEIEDEKLFQQLTQDEPEQPIVQQDQFPFEAPFDTTAIDTTQVFSQPMPSIMPSMQMPTPMQDNLYRTIGFPFGGSNLDAEAIYVLRVIADTLRNNPGISLKIVGHADNQGSKQGIEKFAMARALAVKSWLMNNGIVASRLEVFSAGANEPKGDNNTFEGRALNRRVEIWVAQ